MQNFIIKKPYSDDEIKAVALIHYECINLGFLSKLGSDFLYYLYKSINNCDETELIIAKDNNQVIGFVSGATTLRPVMHYLIRHYFLQTTVAIIPHLFSIKNIKKIYELLKYSKTADQENNLPEAELLSLAVKEKYRGSGVAQMLFSKLMAAFKEKGHDKFKIIVGEELGPAKTFYRKMGAIESGSLNLHGSSQSILFTVEIT